MSTTLSQTFAYISEILQSILSVFLSVSISNTPVIICFRHLSSYFICCIFPFIASNLPVKQQVSHASPSLCRGRISTHLTASSSRPTPSTAPPLSQCRKLKCIDRRARVGTRDKYSSSLGLPVSCFHSVKSKVLILAASICMR